MTPSELLQFLRGHSLAVQASVSRSAAPQAAVVGIIVTDDFEVFFDTLDFARKMHNLRRNPHIAFVIGGLAAGDERTVQYEGVADEPVGADLERLKQLYFIRFPDGRQRQTWPGLVYVRARPTWIRYSDYNRTPPEIIEFGSDDLK
jgi:Pyridoxamine 5'-phosphate oxidase